MEVFILINPIDIFYNVSLILGSTDEGTVGEISINVDLYIHPGTGEQRINVKGK